MTVSSTHSRRLRAIAALVVAAIPGITTVVFGTAEKDSMVAVKAGTIIPIAAEPIANGVILIRNGKIDAVGQAVAIPEGAEIIDASDKVVIPGLIDALTTLAEQADDERTVTPDIKAKDAFDFYGQYHRMLAGGVTTVYVSPGQKRLVGGLGAVVKLAGPSIIERCLSDTAALRITLGERSKNPPGILTPPLPPEPNKPLLPEAKQLPTTRMAQMAVLRKVFAQARLDRQKPPEQIDPNAAVLIQALDRKLPVRINCHNVQDIRNAIALAKEFNLNVIIEGATEAYRAIDQIKDSQGPVVLTSILRPGRSEGRDYTRDIAIGRIDPACSGTLARAGIKFAVSSPTDDAVADLRFIAGCAVAQGLSVDEALKAITIIPAEILGVANRVGSIEKGKDADLVILTGRPFDIRATVDRTIIDGRTVYTRQTDGGQRSSERPTLAVRAGSILTAGQGRINNGLILIKDSKITYVGEAKAVPEGTTVVDVSKSLVVPGMIDIHSHLGLHAESEPVRIDPAAPTTGPNSARANYVSIVNAISPIDEAFGEAMRRGVTSVLLSPATSGLISGNAALIKTAGGTIRDIVVKEYAAVQFSMLDNRQRLTQVWQARDLLKRAKEYADKWDRYEREHQEYEHRKTAAKDEKELKEPERPGRDVNLELLRGLFKHKMTAMVHAVRADEIRTALQVFRDEYGLDVIILGGDDSFRVQEDLKDYRADVAIGPEIITYDKGKPVNNADILARSGLRVAFHTSATSGTQYLPVNAAYAVRHGMDPDKAFRAVTSYPAQMLNVDDRIGSIDVGKDADLVILSGEPFDFATQVQKVIVNGKVVFDSDQQAK